MAHMARGALLTFLLALCLGTSAAEAGKQGAPMQKDAGFLMTAAAAQKAEIALSQIAAERAESEKVKQFAHRMIEDHTKASQEVSQLALTTGITLPEELSAKQQKAAGNFSQLSGAEFDRAYIKHEMSDHKKNVAEFSAQAKTLKDPQIRQWASATLPVLKEHLMIAKGLAADLKKGSTKTSAKR
ncbi:MAG: putative outer membrane protein-like protein [Nitrospira sp.]|jgi:putative membrane protein|nr:putative outer membrane protein-like protein [Nitrospira sp.]